MCGLSLSDFKRDSGCRGEGPSMVGAIVYIHRFGCHQHISRLHLLFTHKSDFSEPTKKIYIVHLCVAYVVGGNFLLIGSVDYLYAHAC